jgi:hypothetical protein
MHCHAVPPNMLGRVVKLLVCIQEMPVSNLIRYIGILVEISFVFSVHAGSGVLPGIGHRQFLL